MSGFEIITLFAVFAAALVVGVAVILSVVFGRTNFSADLSIEPKKLKGRISNIADSTELQKRFNDAKQPAE